MPGLILINPPVCKPSEPPAGIARLAGFLTGHGISCSLVDLNLEGAVYLLGSAGPAAQGGIDTWSRRALRGRQTNLALLKDRRTYARPDRYRRAVSDLERA